MAQGAYLDLYNSFIIVIARVTVEQGDNLVIYIIVLL